MKKGILIYAHNNRSVDYALLAVISGGLAKKHLNVPASLVTDASTVEWMRESKILETATQVFENIIVVNRPITNNTRKLSDGLTSDLVPFINSNRSSVWDLTPYDRTLLIDSDYLTFSNSLGEYWDVEEDVLIGESMNDLNEVSRAGYHDVYVSDVGVKLYWATTVMFTKNAASKRFFDTVAYVKDNYKTYGDIFRFDTRQFRNDIAFSIAKHILSGFEESSDINLPPVLTALDTDILQEVSNNKLTFLVSKINNQYCAAATTGIDVHVMNKQSIVRNRKPLLEMI